MRTVDFYLDLAREKRRFTSDLALDRALGLKPGATCSYRIKRSWPSDETIIKIAEIAELDPKEALLDLNIWRAEGNAVLFYQMLKMDYEKLHAPILEAAE